jgi:hypothetical protein
MREHRVVVMLRGGGSWEEDMSGHTFSQLDVVKILIAPFFCWVVLGVDGPVRSLRFTWVGCPQARERGSCVEYIEQKLKMENAHFFTPLLSFFLF